MVVTHVRSRDLATFHNKIGTGAARITGFYMLYRQVARLFFPLLVVMFIGNHSDCAQTILTCYITGEGYFAGEYRWTDSKCELKGTESMRWSDAIPGAGGGMGRRKGREDNRDAISRPGDEDRTHRPGPRRRRAREGASLGQAGPLLRQQGA